MAVVAAACGGAAAPAAFSTSPGSAQSAAATTSSAATAASGAGQGNNGGVADTPANPDRTYVCAAEATDSSGQAIAYLTVAGSDTPGAQAECAALPQGSNWTAVASSPFHETQYSPVCFVTFDTGQLTARVYTSDTGTFAEGVALCDPLLQQFSLPTLPPS